ncbi:glycosyltransferase family 2 protein [Candidatus Pelagibacter bacterium]|nr:glycosyltransferase family 2 protein [Candidatus Pelagibacter bacterium]
MKIVIQIPCFNEQDQLTRIIDDIRSHVCDFDYDLLIVDDGSTDNTLSVAKQLGVTHVVSCKRNMGLGFAFQKGLDFAKENGYDFLINTDADNQYQSKYINNLFQAIINAKSDIVIGARNHDRIKHFSFLKKCFQKIGSNVVRLISGIKVTDAVSGFRIYSKEAIQNLFVTSKFSYTLDTILQAQDKNLQITEIPIEINAPIRKSRLFKGIFQFMSKQLTVIIKCFIIYKPFEFFTIVSILPFIIGIIPIINFLINYFNNDGGGNIQSLILGSMSLLLSFILIALGIMGFLIKDIRKRN